MGISLFKLEQVKKKKFFQLLRLMLCLGWLFFSHFCSFAKYRPEFFFNHFSSFGLNGLSHLQNRIGE